MTEVDPFIKAVVVGSEVQIRTRTGEVIMRCYAKTPKRAIKNLSDFVDTILEERKSSCWTAPKSLVPCSV